LPGPFSTDEIGEKSLDYSLPPKKIKSFLSPTAYVTSGPGAWQKVTADVIGGLKSKSATRVAKSDEFKKIKDEAKKAATKDKTIKLSDALKETKEKKVESESKKNQTTEEKVAEYLKRPDIQEAANVLADLIGAQARTAMVIGKSGGANKPAVPVSGQASGQTEKPPESAN
jgi:carboxyl-terminal processing protease